MRRMTPRVWLYAIWHSALGGLMLSIFIPGPDADGWRVAACLGAGGIFLLISQSHAGATHG